MPASNSSSWLYSVGHTKATGQGFLLTGAPVVDVCSWLDCVVDANEFADVTVGQFTGVEVVSNVFADVVVGLIVGVKSRVQTSL